MPASQFIQVFDTASLIAQHPPRPLNPNKVLVFERAMAGTHGGTIRYVRHVAAPLPAMLPPRSRAALSAHPDIFSYPSTPGALDWHLNFANADLFCMYGAPVLAQDELQIVEHPALASIREALLVTAREELRTVDDTGPRPVTLLGVERRCILRGLYGRAFARAAPEEVAAAITMMTPPTMSNILAIEAPSGGTGLYTRAQIAFVLHTAYAGFRAAHHETLLKDHEARTVVHTGFWGCGAYGGNRVLMTVLQLIAAHLAGVELVFHAVDEHGLATYREGERVFHSLTPRPGPLQRLLGRAAQARRLDAIIDEILARGFRWGESDGN